MIHVRKKVCQFGLIGTLFCCKYSYLTISLASYRTLLPGHRRGSCSGPFDGLFLCPLADIKATNTNPVEALKKE